ncbi:MAG: hypothetical protein AAGJ95_17850, partial [Cyanobacteria bacterium J06554_11]
FLQLFPCVCSEWNNEHCVQKVIYIVLNGGWFAEGGVTEQWASATLSYRDLGGRRSYGVALVY